MLTARNKKLFAPQNPALIALILTFSRGEKGLLSRDDGWHTDHANSDLESAVPWQYPLSLRERAGVRVIAAAISET